MGFCGGKDALSPLTTDSPLTSHTIAELLVVVVVVVVVIVVVVVVVVVVMIVTVAEARWG